MIIAAARASRRELRPLGLPAVAGRATQRVPEEPGQQVVLSPYQLVAQAPAAERGAAGGSGDANRRRRPESRARARARRRCGRAPPSWRAGDRGSTTAGRRRRDARRSRRGARRRRSAAERIAAFSAARRGARRRASGMTGTRSGMVKVSSVAPLVADGRHHRCQVGGDRGEVEAARHMSLVPEKRVTRSGRRASARASCWSRISRVFLPRTPRLA